MMIFITLHHVIVYYKVMLIDSLGFLKLSIVDVADILLVSLIIFAGLKWMKKSAAANIFLGIFLTYILMLIVDALHMKLMSKLVSTFIDVGVIALIIIFQPEIRHFFMKIGNSSGYGRKARNLIVKIMGREEQSLLTDSIKEITEACKIMSEQKTGALIVFPHKVELENIVNTGDKIDATVSRRLIMNIFFKNSPLHDGAMIIENNRIVAARCTLPITNRTNIPAKFGMRHKAAIGVSEESDADVIVVSEETGRISFVKDSSITPISNINELKLLLVNSFSESMSEPQKQ